MAPTDQIMAAAALIYGENVPQRMPELLRALAGSLKSVAQTHSDFPTRTDIRRRLDRIEEAARLLTDEFHNRHTLHGDAAVLMMQAEGLDSASINRMASDLLSKVAEAAKLAASRIPKGQGRQKALPNREALTPHQMCATIVAFCWCAAHGKQPPPNSKKAQAACEAVWKSAGVPRASFGNSLTGWREPLEAVVKASKDSASHSPINELLRNIEQMDMHLKQRK